MSDSPKTPDPSETRLVSIVVPLLNEEANLPQLIGRLEEQFLPLRQAGYRFEVVLVDDHSTDGTPQVAARLAAQKPWIGVLRLSRNSGSYTAIAAGLECCAGDCAIPMAADLQDPPELIPRLLAKWREGYEVVWAVREGREGESLSTRAFAQAFYWLMRRLTLPEIPATGADFLLMDRKMIDAYRSAPEKHTSFLALVLWMGFRQTFIGYVKQARHTGRSKWTLAKKLKLFIDSLVSFSYAPIRFASVVGLSMAFLGFLYAIVVVVARLTGWVVAGTGFAALMTVLLVGQGLILCMLGVLGEYLWRTFDEARRRPRYVVEAYRPACPGGTPAQTPDAESRSSSPPIV